MSVTLHFRLDKLIERATKASAFVSPDYDAILEVCREINQGGAEAAKYVAERLKKMLKTEREKKIKIYLALHLLESCVMNCGTEFHAAIADRAFLKRMTRLISLPKEKSAAQKRDAMRASGSELPSSGPALQQKVQEKVLELISRWGEAFQQRFPVFYQTYRELAQKGVAFPNRTRQGAPAAPLPATSPVDVISPPMGRRSAARELPPELQGELDGLQADISALTTLADQREEHAQREREVGEGEGELEAEEARLQEQEEMVLGALQARRARLATLIDKYLYAQKQDLVSLLFTAYDVLDQAVLEYERSLESDGTEEEEEESAEEEEAVRQREAAAAAAAAGPWRKNSSGTAVPRQGSGRLMYGEEAPLPAVSPVARSRLIQMASSNPSIQRIASKERFQGYPMPASPPSSPGQQTAPHKTSSGAMGHQRLKLSRGASNSTLTSVRPASQPQLNFA